MFKITCKEFRYMQYLSALVAALPLASGVMYSIWPSPSLPKLASDDSPIGIKITVEEASWLVSTAALGGLCIAVVTIFCMDLLGRKTWMLISGTCLVVPWIVIYFSKNVILICIARFVGGAGNSIAFMTAPVYIAEVVEKDIRGKLAIIAGISALCGSVFMFTVGPFISYFNLSIVCCVLPTIFLVLLYFIPESPFYLVKVGKNNAALNTLKKLSSENSRNTPLVNQRLEEIEETVTYDMQNKSNIWECISKEDYRKSLIIMLGTKTLLQLSGVQVIESYAQLIIAKTGSSISPEISSLLFGVIQIPAAIFASFMVDRLGRRPLWIISATGCAVALFGEGLYFFLDETDSIAWLPTFCILLYILMVPVGISTLPFVIVSEIFPTNIKSSAISVSVLYGSVLAFLCLKYAEPAAVLFGRYTVLWSFACVCLLGILFVLFVVPETKGKSLEEIQQMLNKNRRKETPKQNSALLP